MKCEICGKNVNSYNKLVINDKICCSNPQCKNKVLGAEIEEIQKIKRNMNQMWKYHNVPGYKEKHNKKVVESYKKRYNNDPNFYRSKHNEWNRIWYANNHKKALKRAKEWRKNNPEKIKLYGYNHALKLLKLNPKLTPKSRRCWGQAIRYIEDKHSKYNCYTNFESHHILPVIFYPHFALEEWNGVPLPKEWHNEFHATYNIYDYSLDWTMVLFNFIETKIRESNHDLTTLDMWIDKAIKQKSKVFIREATK